MGIKSVDKTNRLYWLGRYSERVYTTLKLYGHRFDLMIEHGEESYAEFCKSLDIPNIYPSEEVFKKNYPFSHDDPNSIITNLRRAYDNAIELREEIGSETLAYIQLCIYEMNKAAESEAPLMEFQHIIDWLLAFMGIVDDQIEDDNTRSIIKLGKRVERIDLYARLHVDRDSMKREVSRLADRISRCAISYDENIIIELKKLVYAPELDYHRTIQVVETIVL